MAIINRIARLFKADFHAVLDHIEEPDLLLKQAIREMQNEIDITDAHIAQTKITLTNHNNEIEELARLLDDLNDEVKLCLSNDNEDLARNLIKKRLERQYLLDVQNQLLSKAKEQLSRLTQQQEAQVSQLLSSQQKAELFCQMPDQGFTSSSILNTQSFEVSDADIEVALLKEKQQFSFQAQN